jgi:7-carboxy-7-deazaguanine synthase
MNKVLERPGVMEGLRIPVMEQFLTLQGEGFHTGLASWFIRVGGCDVGCHWCDVKESWDPEIHPLTSVDDITPQFSTSSPGVVVITGGEPLMWNMDPLTRRIKSFGHRTHLETSGAYPLTGTWDWICLSPKKNMKPLSEIYEHCNELKVIVYNAHDLQFAREQAAAFRKGTHLFLQPEWSVREKMIPLIIQFVLENPQWKISLQTHKYLGIP